VAVDIEGGPPVGALSPRRTSREEGGGQRMGDQGGKSIMQVQSHWTLPLGLTQFRFQYSTNWPPLMAMTAIATIPIVLLYLFFQRYFVGGLSSGAVKG
jgi:hypothetical protein